MNLHGIFEKAMRFRNSARALISKRDLDHEFRRGNLIKLCLISRGGEINLLSLRVIYLSARCSKLGTDRFRFVELSTVFQFISVLVGLERNRFMYFAFFFVEINVLCGMHLDKWF